MKNNYKQKNNMNSAQKIFIFAGLVAMLIYIFTYSIPIKELTRGTLTGNEWFVEKGNPNDIYDASIWLKFQGGSNAIPDHTVEVWEGGVSKKSCVCNGGRYTINEASNSIKIKGLVNKNCPWMNQLNGTYKYVYDDSRDGFNKFMFRKGNIIITHLFDENR